MFQEYPEAEIEELCEKTVDFVYISVRNRNTLRIIISMKVPILIRIPYNNFAFDP